MTAGEKKDPRRRLAVHASLVRPLLLAGAERDLVLVNFTFAAAVVFGLENLRVSLAAVVVSAAVHTLLVYAGKKDPQFKQIAVRHMHQQDIYPTGGSPFLAKAPLVRPSVYAKDPK